MDNLQTKNLSILVVDDESYVCLGIKQLVKSLGCEVKTASSGEMALTMFDAEKFDLVLSDISMPGIKGDELLKVIKSKSPSTEIILISGFGSIELAVQCMQSGAAHFISKPFNNDEIKNLVLRVCNKILSERMAIFEGSHKNSIIAESPGMKSVMELVKQVAPTKVPILIEGNTGTGKEVVARALHEFSQSSDKEYLAVNCAALPDTLLESELFGHKKGAFTGADSDRVGIFEKANGGTIFLDEIASMSLTFQGKLLRVLQEKVIRPLGTNKDLPVDFRLISASNQNLQALIKEGKIREDLYYRINTMIIRIPPLKDRKEDIIALANYFLKVCAPDCLAEGTVVPLLSVEAIDALINYEWPGNVREIKNVIQSALIMCNGDVIQAHNLYIQKNCSVESVEPIVDFDYEKGKQKLVANFQRQLINKALEKTGGNATQAAEKCGLTRGAFLKIMKSLDIDRSLYKTDS